MIFYYFAQQILGGLFENINFLFSNIVQQHSQSIFSSAADFVRGAQGLPLHPFSVCRPSSVVCLSTFTQKSTPPTVLIGSS